MSESQSDGKWLKLFVYLKKLPRSRSYKTFLTVDFYTELELTNHISHVTNCGFSDRQIPG